MASNPRVEYENDSKGDFFQLFTISSGLSLLCACCFSLWMYNSFLDGNITRSLDRNLIRAVFLIGFCVGGAVAGWLIRHRPPSKRNGIFFFGACLFPLMTAFAFAHLPPLDITFPASAEIVTWSLTGIGLACLFYLWVDALAAFDKKFVVRCLATAVILGGIAYLVINALPGVLSFAAFIVVSIASLLLRKVLETQANLAPFTDTPALQTSGRRAVYIHGGMLFAYGAVFALGLTIMPHFQDGLILYGSLVFLLVAEVAVAYAFSQSLQDSLMQNKVLGVLLPLLVMALLPASIAQGTFYTICNLLLISCFVCIEVLKIERTESMLSTAVLCQIPLFGGLAAGYAICFVADAAGLETMFVATAAIYVLIALPTLLGICSAIIEPRHDVSKDACADDAKTPGRWKSRCLEVAQSNGLSARETEIFLILAKGRSPEYIQNKLFISKHTVKTHIYNIYKKLDVNSREELIDLVETGE